MRKNWAGEGEPLLKNGNNRWLGLLNILFPSQIYIARSLWHLEDFCNIFLPNISKDQKSPTFWARGLGTVSHAEYGAGYCITFIKSLDEGQR